MNKIITHQDLAHTDFRSLWELQNPKFSQAPDGSHEAGPQFKLRHSGSSFSFLTNYLSPSRLYGFRKLFAGLLWVFVGVLLVGTVLAYRTGAGEMGQIYFTLFFVGLYLLFFVQAGKSRLRRWESLYTKAVKTDVTTYSDPAIIFDGQDILLANTKIFDLMAGRSVAAFIGDIKNELKQSEKQAAQEKRAAETEKARLKKEQAADAAKQVKKDEAALKALGGGVEKSSGGKGSLASRAAKAARGTSEGDFLASRAARAARGAPPRQSNNAPASEANPVKIEGYTGSYWQSCATGLDNNPNYIARRMVQIRKSNPNFIKFRAVDSKGRIVDMG